MKKRRHTSRRIHRKNKFNLLISWVDILKIRMDHTLTLAQIIRNLTEQHKLEISGDKKWYVTTTTKILR